jgi:peptidyl-prolyl cis-trans isomerase SurA
MKRICIWLLLLAAAGVALNAEAIENLLAKPAQPVNSAAIANAPIEGDGQPVVDRIVAVVNSDIITLSDLDNRTNMIAAQLTRQGITLPDRPVLMRQVLDRMVTDQVLLQHAKEIGLHVDDAQLDEAISRIAAENKMPLDKFREAVKKEGLTFDRFREEIRKEMTLARLRDREVESHISVSDSEIDAQLEQEAARGTAAQEEYELAHILVAVPENATPDQVALRQKKIQNALDQLNKGANFNEVATAMSEAPDALKGGNLGWRSASRLPSLFAEAISKLQPGQYTDIMRSPNGFHIVKLINKRGSGAPAPITQYHVRQILIKPGPQLTITEAEAKISLLYVRLEAGEDFGKLATLNSEDESRNRNGDLGWLSEGETLPQFEKEFMRLKPGGFSQPFETPLGWHIVQLLGTRQADATLERRRLTARQGLRARKADEAYDEWVRELRDQAYVDIRLDDR